MGESDNNCRVEIADDTSVTRMFVNVAQVLDTANFYRHSISLHIIKEDWRNKEGCECFYASINQFSFFKAQRLL